jgi:hypothetical protein
LAAIGHRIAVLIFDGREGVDRNAGRFCGRQDLFASRPCATQAGAILISGDFLATVKAGRKLTPLRRSKFDPLLIYLWTPGRRQLARAQVRRA